MNSLEEVFKTWQDATLDTWSFATKQVTNNETWFNATNAQMDVYLAGMKKMRGAVAASLEALDLPKKDDLVRISEQVLSAETRTAECEDRLDRTESQLKAATAAAKAAEQKAAAAEERLAKLEAAIAELSKQPAAEKAPEAEKKPRAVSSQAKVIKSRRNAK